MREGGTHVGLLALDTGASLDSVPHVGSLSYMVAKRHFARDAYRD